VAQHPPAQVGNLTLATGALNASLSNGPWDAPDKPTDKCRGLVNHSLLKLNTALANDYPERFDERAVDERGQQLADVAIRIWPGPEAPARAPGP
jgi:hypothetical protein